MVVRTQSKGHGVTGLYIGGRNARRYFKQYKNGIELQLGHLQIHCELGDEFWQGRPVIFDSRLSDWLESRVLRSRCVQTPIPVLMTPAEKNCFKLHPIRLPRTSPDRPIRPGSTPQTRPAGTKGNNG